MPGESNLFQEQWDPRVTHAFQQKGWLLRGMTMGPYKIVGKKLHFAIMGKGEAQDYTVGDTVKKMGVMKGQLEIDSREFDAADDIFEDDLDKMAANAKDALVDTAAMALGRKYDLITFDELRAKDFSGLGQTVGAFSTGFGPSEALKARRAIYQMDAPVEDGQVFCGVPPIVMDNLMSYEVFSNSQWVGGAMPFAQAGMRAKTWQNVHYFELPPYLQTVANATEGKFYMWHKSAIGTGHIGDELKTAWEYILNKKKWYYQGTLNGGATLITDPNDTGHPLAIIECRYDTAEEPTFS